MQVEQVDFVSVPTRVRRGQSPGTATCSGCRSSEYSEAELETPNVTLSFWNPEADGEEFVPNRGIALRVADVKAAVEEVRGRRREVIGIEDSGVCHMGFVKDPDGNVLILHRRYAPRG